MLILSGPQIQRSYGVAQAISDLTAALQAEYAKKVQNPARTVLSFPSRDATCLYMPSAIADLGVMGGKIVSIFPQNPARGLPTTQGVTVLSDAATGEHLALLSASYLTRLRTGALSGLAVQHLAREDAGRLGVIGTGGMAPEQIRGIHAGRAPAARTEALQPHPRQSPSARSGFARRVAASRNQRGSKR